MSLMNDALRNLDESHKHNIENKNIDNHKDIRYIHNVLKGDQATISKLAFGRKTQSDAFGNVGVDKKIFDYFYIYFFIGLLFLVAIFMGYIFLYKEKNIVQPDSYNAISQDELNGYKLDNKKESYDKKINDNEFSNITIVGDDELKSSFSKEIKNISLLNDKGYAALANDFLSTPKNNNAMSYFQKVLAIDENNILARQGVDSVYRRYKILIASNIERQDWFHAQTMLNRFLAVGGDKYAIKNYKQLIDRNVSNDKEVEITSNNIVFNDINETSYLSVKKSSHHQEKEAFSRSQYWVQKNQIQKAIDELNTVLNTQGYLTKATAEFMFDLYLRIGNIDAARAVSHYVRYTKKTRLSNRSWDAVYENARIEQVQVGDLAALSLLHKTKAEWLGESSARLYAGLLHKNGDYALAQKIYRNLLDVYHKNATYWLGYSVSSDALGDLDNALTGYRKAQILGDASSNVQSYIADRIFALQSSVNALSHVMEPSW